MKFYIVKRLLLIGPTVLGVAVLVFFLMRVIPGDICLVRWVDYGTDLDPSLLEFCRNDLGLNAPLHVQFFQFIQGIVTFDLGHSMWTGRPVIEELALRFPLSLQLAIMATIFCFDRYTAWSRFSVTAKHLARLLGPFNCHHRQCHPFILVRHSHYSGPTYFFPKLVWGSLDATD